MNPFLSTVATCVTVGGEPQTLALDGTRLSISDGNEVDLAPILDHTNDGAEDHFDVFGNQINTP